MTEKHDTAHDIAEEALEALEDGDEAEAKSLLEEAKKLDPSAVEELTAEIEQERTEAEQYVEEHKGEVANAEKD